ncbi:MAG: glycerol-3-phosphate 1-O-acyltransferase PlsY [Gammaproteobacteria bacterium]|nr:glycerol-3-phosphate 1-O-acyltransferase PlsY [Gammaproteobacteria bacterium]
MLSYLVGSVSGALVAGRYRGIDIRNEGSGNAGATNALRTHGVGFAALVMLIDVGKGVLAVLVIAPLAGFGEQLLPLPWIAAFCGLAAVIGHIFPFWFDFRGGKGGATAIGALAALSPLALAPVLAVWVITVIATGFVGLSTMLAGITVAVFPLLYRPDGFDAPLLMFGVGVALLIVYAHRSNIGRMLAGDENRMEAAMLWRRDRHGH